MRSAARSCAPRPSARSSTQRYRSARPLLDEGVSPAAQRDLPHATVPGVFRAFHQAALDQAVHELAGRPGADAEHVPDVVHLAAAGVVQPHQERELRHGETRATGEHGHPVHGADGEALHPVAKESLYLFCVLHDLPCLLNKLT